MEKSLGWKASGLALAGAGLLGGAMLMRKRATRAPLLIAGKTVIITGGSRGLGLALGEEFGRAGANLVLAARSESELQTAKQMLLTRGAVPSENRIELVACDLRENADCLRLGRVATERFGQVNILINNAGVIHVGPIEKQPLEAYRDAMESDFFAGLQMTYAVMPQMLERGEGSIVNISSIGGKIPVPHLAPYNAAKFATTGFSETLHAEMRTKGIRVTTVCPGLLRTGSYPNAIVVGDLEKEYRWFSVSASLPGVAHETKAAAEKIFAATLEGRTEITIGRDAYLAARIHGLMPETVQFAGCLADQFILPKTTGTTTPTPARRIRSLRSGLWQSLSRQLTQAQNQPSA